MATIETGLKLAKWSRTIWFLKDLTRVYTHLYDQLDRLIEGEGDEWRRFQLRCENDQSAEPADDAYCTFDIVNYTGGAVDPTWTTTDYSTAANHINNICQRWSVHMSNGWHFTDLKAYVMRFNPDYAGPKPPGPDDGLDHKPFIDSGPPVYEVQLNVFGQVAPILIPQAAFSVTELTPTRRHWGRFYLPGPGNTTLSGAGQYTGAVVDDMAEAVHTEYAALQDVELYPVVVQLMANKVVDQALIQITGIQVDSNPDVIRRRRPKVTLYHQRLTTARESSAEQQPS